MKRSDTPWQLQGGLQNGQSKYIGKYIQQNDRYLRRNNDDGKVFLEREVERKVEGNKEADRLTTPSADQVAIDDDSFSGNAGSDETDGGGGGGILGPVSSHAQSNDLWLLPLRVYGGIIKEEEGSTDSSHENDRGDTVDSLYSDMNDDNSDNNNDTDDDGNDNYDNEENTNNRNDDDDDDYDDNNSNDDEVRHQPGSSRHYFHKYDVDVDVDVENWNIFSYLYENIFDVRNNSTNNDKDKVIDSEKSKYDDSDSDDIYNSYNNIVDKNEGNKNEKIIMKEIQSKKVIGISSSGGNSGSHKGKGAGTGYRERGQSTKTSPSATHKHYFS